MAFRGACPHVVVGNLPPDFRNCAAADRYACRSRRASVWVALCGRRTGEDVLGKSGELRRYRDRAVGLLECAVAGQWAGLEEDRPRLSHRAPRDGYWGICSVSF